MTALRGPLLVFVGGGLGAGARAFILDRLTALGSLTPVLLVNLAGACALGVVFVLADEAGLLTTDTRLFLAVGLLGGFTTFSTYTWGVDVAAGGGHPAIALSYACIFMVGGILATILGIVVTRRALHRVAPHSFHRSAAEDMASIETDNRAL